MPEKDQSLRELLFADLALGSGAANAEQVATALQRYWESPPDQRIPVAQALELDPQQHARIEAEVDRAVAVAEGDARAALARRGGIDRDIHTSLRPETSAAILRGGAGARAPLRRVAGDRYSDFTLVGKGGMGVVYLALDTELHRRVAFKMVRPDPNAPRETPAPETPLSVTPPTEEHTDDARSFEELRIRFLQEAWVTGAMEHPGVVPVYELGETAAGIPYYTMRYVKGERTLASAMSEARDLDARLVLLEPFLKICDAVRYAHARDVIHRDLKPENIALGEFGEVIVLDWGLSKMEHKPDLAGSLWRSRVAEFRDATDLSTLAGVLGTPGYMAPEAALGRSEEVDAQSDIYSLGAILYQILTGRLPFRFQSFMEFVHQLLEEAPPPVHEVAPEVPLPLSEVCQRALSRRKEERFATVEELAQEVRRWQTEGRLEQQVLDLATQAETELGSARTATGNMMLWHLDRATVACTRILHLRKGHARATALMQAIKQLRERGIRERVRSSRLRVIVTAGFAILAVATIVALYVVGILAEQRREAEERVRREQNRATARQLEAREARERELRSRGRLANAYAGLARLHAKKGWVAAARLAAAKAVQVAPTPEAWAALAHAEARWTPTLRVLLEDARATALAFDPAGERIFVGGGGDQPVLRVFDLVAGDWRQDLGQLSAPVRHLAVSPDGALLCAVTGKGPPGLWDARSGKFSKPLLVKVPPKSDEAEILREIGTALASAGPTTALVFGPDGRRVYTGHRSGYIVEWDVAVGFPIGILQRSGAAVTALHAGPRGKYLYCGDAGGEVSRREIGHFTNSTDVETGGGVIAQVLPSEDGGYLHVCTLGLRMFMLELDPPRLFSEFEGPTERAFALIHSSDRGRIYVAGEHGIVQVWDVEARALLARLDGFGSEYAALALAPDGRLLAQALADGTVRIWDLTMAWSTGGTEPTGAVVVARDGWRTYLARPDHTIEVWDDRERRSLGRLAGHSATITALALDDEKRLLFSAALDRTLRTWDATTAEAQAVVRMAEEPITALAVVPGGEVVYAGTSTGEIQLWSWRRRRKMAQFGEKGLPIGALRLDGERLLARDVSGAVRAWSTRTQDPLPGAERAYVSPATEAPVLGSTRPWALKDPLRRLIETENRLGLMLEGFEVIAVPPPRYRPHRPRLESWSK
ncbi:MAG: WD40 repeat domain-containing serine/threonine protein kinase [Planctomycetota bacterium]